MLTHDVIVDFFRWLIGMEPQKQAERALIPIKVEDEPQDPQRRRRS